jgi:uncharacterized protein
MNSRYESLTGFLRELGRVAVAFSGGVDSSFLLAAARDALGDEAIGITIDSPALPRSELEDAVSIAAQVGAKHIIIDSPEIEEEVKRNPVDRCYFCKKIEFGSIMEEAKRQGIKYVLDGSNVDDTGDYRPGMAAIKELKVLSPLLELGFTKREIREYSKKLGLPTWDKPAYACLYSRIPYGSEIKTEDLQKIEQSEKFLIKRGFRTSRVRCHDIIARIEVSREETAKLLKEPLRSEITEALKSYGFLYVTIDLEGYRMGSMNEAIELNKR